MKDFPLHTFFHLLASDEIVLSVHDYNRLLLAFQIGGVWTLQRLRNVVVAILAQDEHQSEIIGRRFDKVFDTQLDPGESLSQVDFQKILVELNLLKEEARHPGSALGTTASESSKQPTTSSAQKVNNNQKIEEEIPFWRKNWRWLLGLLLITIGGGFFIG